MSQPPAATGLLGAVLLATIVLADAGCSTRAPDRPTGSTLDQGQGELDATLERSLDRTARACRRTIEELGFVLRSHSQDRRHAVFTASDAADQLLEIHLEQATAASTRLKIRSGDETLRHAVLVRLNSNL